MRVLEPKHTCMLLQIREFLIRNGKIDQDLSILKRLNELLIVY